MSTYDSFIEQQRYTCAIGALQTVAAIKKAVPILHSGPGCGDMIAGFFERSASYGGGNTSPCTNFTEKEVVFGGIDRLRQIIKNTYKVLDTDLQVVMTGCTAGIVGDDVDSLVREFADEGLPIVSVETAGFKASNYEAHATVVNAILSQYVSLYEEDIPARSEANTVNLLASIPYQDPFWKGNLREYKRLLEGIGLKVHILFGPESGGVREWQQIPRANFNILVSPWYGKAIADQLRSTYGQDYLWYRSMPIGANATEDFLNQVIDFALKKDAHIDETAARAFVGRESAAYYEELDNLASFLIEFRYGLPAQAHILHDAGYVVGLSRFLLHETGIVPIEQFIVDGTPEKYREAIQADLAAVSDTRTIPVFFEPDAGNAQNRIRALEHSRRTLIIGAGWDKNLADEIGADFLNAAAPSPYRMVMTTNYVGFSGGLRVMEDIYNNTLLSYK